MGNLWNKRWNISWSNLILAVVGIILLVLVWVSNPISKGCFRPVTSDTVITRDTQWLPQPTVFVPQYIPVKTHTEVPVYIPREWEPSKDTALLMQQYRNLANAHFSTNFYKDTITLKDSSGRNVGKVRIGDKVNQNRLLPRDVDYTLEFPIVTNTVTITKKEPPRAQVYLGAGVTGSPQQIVNGAFVGVMLKNKKDNIFGVQGGFKKYPQRPMSQEYGISYYQKLSFRKR